MQQQQQQQTAEGAARLWLHNEIMRLTGSRNAVKIECKQNFELVFQSVNSKKQYTFKNFNASNGIMHSYITPQQLGITSVGLIKTHGSYLIGVQNYEHNMPVIVFKNYASQIYMMPKVMPDQELDAKVLRRLKMSIDRTNLFYLARCEKLLISYLPSDHIEFKQHAFYMYIRDCSAPQDKMCKRLSNPQAGKLFVVPQRVVKEAGMKKKNEKKDADDDEAGLTNWWEMCDFNQKVK